MAGDPPQRCWFSGYVLALCLLALALGGVITFEKTSLQGTSTKPVLRRWTTNNEEHCATACAGVSECKSFSVKPSLQECSLYSSHITFPDILLASSSEEETFYWKRHGCCPEERGYVVLEADGPAGKCVHVETGLQNWSQAQASCQTEGGHLLLVPDMAAWRAVYAHLQSVGQHLGSLFVGALRRSGGQVLWLDGGTVQEDLWYPNQPDSPGEVCVQIWWPARDSSSLLLDDTQCYWELASVCEL